MFLWVIYPIIFLKRNEDVSSHGEAPLVTSRGGGVKGSLNSNLEERGRRRAVGERVSSCRMTSKSSHLFSAQIFDMVQEGIQKEGNQPCRHDLMLCARQLDRMSPITKMQPSKVRSSH